MVFSLRVAGSFSRKDWSRGQSYYRSGAVHINQLTDTSVLATVKGAISYHVSLEWVANTSKLRIFCTCPRFADADVCKHVAAAVFAASDQGFGSRWPGSGDLDVVASAPGGFGRDVGDGEQREADRGAGKPDSSNVSARDAENSGTLRTGDLQRLLEAAQSTVADRRRPPPTQRQAPTKAPVSSWKGKLNTIRRAVELERTERGVSPRERAAADWEPWYAIDLERSRQRGQPVLVMCRRPLKKDGTRGKLRVASVSIDDIEAHADVDRRLIGMLVGNGHDDGYRYAYNESAYEPHQRNRAFFLRDEMLDVLLPRLCATGRFGWFPSTVDPDEGFRPLAWDDGPPWQLKFDLSRTADGNAWRLSGSFVRGEETAPFGGVGLILAREYLMFADRIARFESHPAIGWAAAMRGLGELLVPVAEADDFVESLATMPTAPPFELPAELQWSDVSVAAMPKLTIARQMNHYARDFECRLAFLYGDREVQLRRGPAIWFDRPKRQLIRRDLAAEAAAEDRLYKEGLRPLSNPYAYDEQHSFRLKPNAMPGLVERLVADGWKVEAEGRLIRTAGKVSLSVSSGVDWFDLEGTCDFEGASATLPQLLEAVRTGQSFVVLGDGSHGMLPADWLAKYGAIADMGEVADDAMRFRPGQAALLDALLAAQESNIVKVDRSFARLREKLKSFDGVAPRSEPRTFRGVLREYQREGLGWLKFLDDFGFGGCLADDMGLGKTVQVLAMLEGRRTRSTGKPKRSASSNNGDSVAAMRLPSLVVAPKSLIFNWMDEAQRFAPKLKLLRYTGFERHEAFAELGDFDVILTTYGTLRKDIADLSQVEFDYAILDEAQAIKNANSQSAKACRLIRAQRRLALSGTPVENHLGELWSLFEFLNPGMLGRNQKLHERFSVGAAKPSLRLAAPANGKTSPSHSTSVVAGGAQTDAPSPEQAQREGLQILARAIRPFMLRRTKQQVLSELPEKTQQTLYCDLDTTQRKLYNELRDHYRRSLLERIDSVGVNRSKIQVLEALLRLRQAACHPGLLDPKKADKGSAKLETLLETLEEVIAEGHKALVFSQFTSFLAIVAGALKQRQITFEYLDGKTTDRQQRVERFQTDAACPLFLISLKAGGQGLNLTAADYVFILDPWWNPAVEAQAVDRAHRMGQSRHVFAYRLIARDTVEEKILQLQDQKRDLADAIISADNSVIRNLTAEDLQLLLG
jgi:superfamily II DNA or RNA helicase